MRVIVDGPIKASSEAVSRRMASQGSKNTHPEVDLRRILHRRGRRFRVHYRPEPSLRRTPDIVFTRARVLVFVDGCFWHQCPDHKTIPKANAEWWATKLDKNNQRDRDTDARFTALGWTVVRVWEHIPPELAADLVEQALERAIDSSGRAPR